MKSFLRLTSFLLPFALCLLPTLVIRAQSSDYILTPTPGKIPRINGTTVFGVRPGSPVVFKIAATGEKPLKYEVLNLPVELKLDSKTGIISGRFSKEGIHILKVRVSNKSGKAEKELTIKVGQTISLTPPMGWNSWNAFGESVSQEKVKAVVQAMIDKGLVDHGWSYVNIDDGWQGVRNATGVLEPNDKFPDMKGLADWIHSQGLKFGIYSSPGPTTCLGLPGSWQYEEKDAATWSGWDIDYLKYDLCSYKWDIFDKAGDTSQAAWMKPFLSMRKPLDAIPRDIIFSICSYNTIPWAAKVGANLTRLLGDNRDEWKPISTSGSKVDKYWAHQKPGLWNDEDLLVVGSSGGWEGKARPNHLTPDEQYFHMSLWSLLATPLFISCDLASADDFTISLLSNDEVIEVNQDPLGKAGRLKISTPEYQVWVKELADGTHAAGIFNLKNESQAINVKWSDLSIEGGIVRDLWKQKNMGKFSSEFKVEVPPHGVMLIKIFQ